MTHELLSRLGLDPAGDPRWLVVADGFNAIKEHEVETLLSIGNGYLGTRGSLEEGSSIGKPSTLVAGYFDPKENESVVPALVIMPDWLHLVITIDDQVFHAEDCELLGHRRWLDMQRGVMVRQWRWRDYIGRITSIITIRFASLDSPHTLMQRLIIKPENYSARIQISAGLDGRKVSRGRRASEGGAKLNELDARPLSEGGVLLEMITESAKLRCALASKLVVAPESNPVETVIEREWQSQFVSEHCSFDALLGQTYVFDKFVSIYTERDLPEPANAAVAHLQQIHQTGFEQLYQSHLTRWQHYWQSADVVITGDDFAQHALRFCLYHLLIVGNPNDERVSIGARTLSGPSYNGHVFWDTELFMLPFFTFIQPAAARAMLMYRYHTIDGARKKARDLGYRGTLYAWESAVTGEETTPAFVFSPTGEKLPVYSGLQQHHITADIAYAICQYWQATRDDQFILDAGAEVMLEAARFWASRATLGSDNQYHILEVMGPDEYHHGVDDNAFTNYLARWTIERTHELIDWLRSNHAERANELMVKLAITDEELQTWRVVANGLVSNYHPDSKLYEQFQGFFSLRYVDLKEFEPRSAPMEVILGQEPIRETQIIKQPDVIMLLYLFPQAFSEAIKAANFNFYDPLCGHGSSLSPAICAATAARVGHDERAKHYFHQAASIDLENNMGNAAGGIHAAACGGLWQAVVFGFAGLTLEPGYLQFEPRLPAGWQRLKFSLHWQQSLLEVEISDNLVRLQLRAGRGPISVAVKGGEVYVLTAGQIYEKHYQRSIQQHQPAVEETRATR